MLPTPKQTTASVQQRGPNGRFVSNSVAPGETNNATNTSKWTYQSFLGIKSIADSSTLMIKSLTDINDSIATLTNITSMMETTLENMLALAQDNNVRRQQDDERSDDAKPVKTDGIVASVKGYIEKFGIATAVLGLFTLITTLSKDIEKSIQQGITTYLVAMSEFTKNLISGWVSSLKAYFGKELTEGEISKLEIFVQSILTRFSGVIERFVRVVGEIGRNPIFQLFERAFGTIFELVGKITKIVFRIMDVVLVPAIAIVSKFSAAGLDMFRFLTKWIGKIFWPLQILMSTIDFINGFIEGYEKGGVIEGIKKGLAKVFDGLVIGFVDMIKDIVGWVMDKLGAHKMATAWRENVTKLMSDLTGWFQSIIDIFVGLVTLDPKTIWAGIKGSFGSGLGFMMHLANGVVELLLGLFDDIFKTDLGGKFDELKKNFVQDIIDDVTSFTSFLKDWFSGIFTDLRNWVTGTHTQADVDKKAMERATERAMAEARASGQRPTNTAGHGIHPVVTDEDRTWAASQYPDVVQPNGRNTAVAPAPMPTAARQAAALTSAAAPTAAPTTNMQTNIQNISQGGRAAAPAVIPMGRVGAPGHPINRYN